jgi:2-octaprenyl-6-methoxyphenol hydroxylase
LPDILHNDTAAAVAERTALLPYYDVVIVGGGPVGSALALGLRAAQRSVLLLDANPEPQAGDPRTLALSYGSRLILERLEIWNAIAPLTAIATIHISQRGGFGSVILTATDAQTPALGYVASYASLQHAMHARAGSCPNLEVRANTRVTGVEERPDGLVVAFEQDGRAGRLNAALAIVADGGALTQQLAAIEVRDYAQSAVVCNVTTSIPHRHIAFERFTSEGPLALLPREREYAVVWTVASEHGTELCTATEPAFLGRLQSAFGMRAGKFLSVQRRAAFPLALRVARDPLFDRMLLIGNAAQALHPVAGQGLNLGLRDAWELAQGLCAMADISDVPELTRSYRQSRRRDRRTSIGLTDAMARVFSNDHLAMQWLRGCGLTFLDCVPPAKRRFMQQMMFGASW